MPKKDSCFCTGTAKEETCAVFSLASQIIAVGPAEKGVHSLKK